MDNDEVSVRELRQNLSVHLRRVREGRTLAVTSRGERVAILAPIGRTSRLDLLQAEGRVSAAERPWQAPAPTEHAQSATQALLAERVEDDR